MNTVLLALDKQLAFYSSNFMVALFIIYGNEDAKDRCWKTGQPKYFPRDSLCGTLKIIVASCF